MAIQISPDRKATDLPVRPMGRIRHMHFVGIGGSGMSGIAEVLHNLGYVVTGSDLSESNVTSRLRKLGIKVSIGHAAANLQDCDALVISSAVSNNNPEVGAARAKRIPIVPRAEMLAELMRFRYGIAVAGTHGKTTATSLIASLLAEGGLDPTFVIGGRLNSIGTHAQLGSGEFLVAEADESDASFLYLQPMMAIVTNIDADHMQTYQNDFANLRQSFVDFLHHLPFYGLAVLCVDDDQVRELLPQISRPVLTYGLSRDADIYGRILAQENTRVHFRVMRSMRSGELDVNLNLAGRHNVLNALAAISVAQELGIPDQAIKSGLENFAGIARRFQVYGEIETVNGPILMIDDYAHHPREITATLNAIRQGWRERRLVTVFQPHRYTRTRDLFDDFVRALSETDILLVLDVYPAGEAPISGADSRNLCSSIRARGQVSPIFIEDISELSAVLNNLLVSGDILLTMGAGNIGAAASQLPVALKRCRNAQ